MRFAKIGFLQNRFKVFSFGFRIIRHSARALPLVRVGAVFATKRRRGRSSFAAVRWLVRLAVKGRCGRLRPPIMHRRFILGEGEPPKVGEPRRGAPCFYENLQILRFLGFLIVFYCFYTRAREGRPASLYP